MPRLVAFLRAINVGGHTVTMEELRRLFGAIGLTDVETFIASGNVIFASSSRNLAVLERQIEDHLRIGSARRNRAIRSFRTSGSRRPRTSAPRFAD